MTAHPPRFILATAAIASVVLTGAACFPVTYDRAPQIDGVVTRDGRPLAGLPVRLVLEPPPACERAEQRTTTDESGSFHLDRTQRTYWQVVGMPMYRMVNAWTLCAGTAAAGDTTWAPIFGMDIDSGPRERVMTCELATPASASGRWPCRVTEQADRP